jgi:general L-amino acid transport system permease protein
MFIRVHFEQFMYGFYPEAQRWRVDMLVLLLIFGAAPLFIRLCRPNQKAAGARLAACVSHRRLRAVAGRYVWACGGGHQQLGRAAADLVIAGVGMTAALPLGVLLGLGRRSTNAGDSGLVRDVYRTLARRSADYRAVHVLGDAAAVPAGWE